MVHNKKFSSSFIIRYCIFAAPVYLNMNKIFWLIILVPGILSAQTKKEKKANAATAANIKAHIQFLSDDKLEGRRTGTAGEQLAAGYISGMFAKYGLQPMGTDGFFQPFDVKEGKQFTEGANIFLVDGDSLQLNKDFYPLAYSANSSINGTASRDLQEREEPWFWDVNELLEENKNNPHFDVNDAIKKQAKELISKKVKALIVYNSSAITDNILFNKNDTSTLLDIPVVYITKEGLQHHFSEHTATFDIEIKVSFYEKKRTGTNVIGYLNFNAPTCVIIGAHYDHLGYGEDGNSLDGQGQIHNGADDNASGTAALMEMARLLQSTKAQQNNYLFMAFSGEELGLFGSKYWVANPTRNIVPDYMINMDMIGRYDSARKLTVGGYGTSPEWGNVFQTVNHKNLVVKFDSSGSGPSDHATFYRKDIPVLFFFTNSHSDYHKATDDWDKINYSGETDIINYINKIIVAANDKGKLAFTKTRDMESRSVALPVTLGVIPDYGFSGTGMRIDGVSKGKLAERLGLQAGDVLIQLGEYKFVDVMSYMSALQKFKKGDITTLIIKRGATEMTFDIPF